MFEGNEREEKKRGGGGEKTPGQKNQQILLGVLSGDKWRKYLRCRILLLVANRAGTLLSARLVKEGQTEWK